MSEKSDGVIRRRVRLLTLLPATRPELCDALGVGPKTVIRDMDWLRDHGVPLTGGRSHVTAYATWRLAPDFEPQQWLWDLLTAEP